MECKIEVNHDKAHKHYMVVMRAPTFGADHSSFTLFQYGTGRTYKTARAALMAAENPADGAKRMARVLCMGGLSDNLNGFLARAREAREIDGLA